MIEKLYIKNFKSIKNINIDLKMLNLLSGINSSGKSTLCQVLLLIQKYARVISSSSGNRDNLSINHNDFSLGKVKDVLYEGANTDRIEFACNFCMSDEAKKVVFNLNAEDKDMDYLKIVMDPSLKNFYKEAPFFGAIKYLRADRVGPKVIQDKNDEKVIEQKEIGSSGEYTYSFLDKYGKDKELLRGMIENRAHIKSQNDLLIEQVSSWLGEISPNINLRTKELDGTNLVNLSYSYTTNIGESNHYRTNNVGFGLSYCLPVIVMCMIARKGDIIIIDTPEAHLHPKGQVILGELLTKTAADGVQVIVETHSDHVINGVRKATIKKYLKPKYVNFLHFIIENTHEISMPFSNILSPKLNTDGTFDSWPDGFFDEWIIAHKQFLDLRSNS